MHAVRVTVRGILAAASAEQTGQEPEHDAFVLVVARSAMLGVADFNLRSMPRRSSSAIGPLWGQAGVAWDWTRDLQERELLDINVVPPGEGGRWGERLPIAQVISLCGDVLRRAGLDRVSSIAARCPTGGDEGAPILSLSQGQMWFSEDAKQGRLRLALRPVGSMETEQLGAAFFRAFDETEAARVEVLPEVLSEPILERERLVMQLRSAAWSFELAAWTIEYVWAVLQHARMGTAVEVAVSPI